MTNQLVIDTNSMRMYCGGVVLGARTVSVPKKHYMWDHYYNQTRMSIQNYLGEWYKGVILVHKEDLDKILGIKEDFLTERHPYRIISVGDLLIVQKRKALLKFPGEKGLDECDTDMIGYPEVDERVNNKLPLVGQLHSFIQYINPGLDFDIHFSHYLTLFKITPKKTFVCFTTGMERLNTGTYKAATGNALVSISVPHSTEEQRNTWQHNGYFWVSNAIGSVINPSHISDHNGQALGTLISTEKEPPEINIEFKEL